MGDCQVRGFGWRCLLVLERVKKADPAPEAPMITSHHSGAFEPNAGRWYDDKEVSLGFGMPPK